MYFLNGTSQTRDNISIVPDHLHILSQAISGDRLIGLPLTPTLTNRPTTRYTPVLSAVEFLR